MPCFLARQLGLMVCASFVSAALAAPQTLPREVESALLRAQVPAQSLAVVVQEVTATRPRLTWQAEAPVNPASLMKLVTTAAALDLLGPAWTWSTPVWLDGTVQDGVLQGNLVIKGQGDPKLVMERLWLLLRRVQQLGVREIRGDIVFDRSAFSVAEKNPAEFDNEPLRAYNVGADALLFNYKSLVLTIVPDAARGIARVTSEPPLAGVTIDASVPLAEGPCEDWRQALKADFNDPAALRLTGRFSARCGEKMWPLAYADAASYNQRAVLGLWREMGGRLSGSVHDGTAPSGPPSFEQASPPLSEIVRDINKYSNNLMAQQLFLTLGLTQRGGGTVEASRRVVAEWMRLRHGRLADGLLIDNGSGLSRDSRITAQLLMRVLQTSWAGPTMSEMMSSLPVSGTDGTLRRSRAAPGRAHLKTGSLRDVAAMAGYVLGNSGRRYVLVAIINHPNANAARPALEGVLQWAVNDGTARAGAGEEPN